MSEPDYKAMLERLCAAIDGFSSWEEYVGSDEVWQEMPKDIRQWWTETPEKVAAAAAKKKAEQRWSLEHMIRDLRARLHNTAAPVASNIDDYIERTKARVPLGVDAVALVRGEIEKRKLDALELEQEIAEHEAELKALG